MLRIIDVWMFVALAGCLAAAAAFGGETPALRLKIQPQAVKQGDCFFVHLEGLEEGLQPEVSWADKKIPLFKEKKGWRAILPVWIEIKPGPHRVPVVWTDSRGREGRLTATVNIEARQFGIQHLRLAAQQEALYTYPGVEREYQLIGEALHRLSPVAQWEGKFIIPVKGKQKTAFGLRRYRNGKKQGIHKGIDYGAPQGAPVVAANSGVVALTAEDFQMHGKTIVIDHGQGVCTLYLHLSAIGVQPGQEVKKGETIARVGSTGVATGPHLHYALYVDRVAVDPAWWENKAR